MAFTRSGVQLPYPPLDLRRENASGSENGAEKMPPLATTNGGGSEPFSSQRDLGGSQMHTPKPWFRKQKNCWYVQINGRQLSLGPDEKQAWKKFHRLVADGIHQPLNLTVETLCDKFLEFSEREHERETYGWYARFLQKFCDQYGAVKVSVLRPYHVNGWAAQWKNDSTRRCAIVAVKRAVSWGISEGYLEQDPLKTLKKPPAKRR